jgi:hypothetical protein
MWRTAQRSRQLCADRPPRLHRCDLAGFGVLGEDHRHDVVRLAGLATEVYQHEERSAQHPALVAATEPRRRPEDRERQPSRCTAKAEPRPLPVARGRPSAPVCIGSQHDDRSKTARASLDDGNIYRSALLGRSFLGGAEVGAEPLGGRCFAAFASGNGEHCCFCIVDGGLGVPHPVVDLDDEPE